MRRPAGETRLDTSNDVKRKEKKSSTPRTGKKSKLRKKKRLTNKTKQNKTPTYILSNSKIYDTQYLL